MSRVVSRAIISGIFMSISFLSQAYVCMDAYQSSKSTEISFQNVSSRDQLNEIQKYTKNTCPSLNVLSVFSDYVQIGPIKIEQDIYSPPLLPGGEDGADRRSCKVAIPYQISGKAKEEMIECFMDTECPTEFLNKPIIWENEKHSGGDTRGC
ncbi:MAG: hypothetical protein IPK68_20175 [Bdellovibrionales bacterium]|nr:hypothetical protein [Bdellovibrionales bacterium]